MKKIGIGSAAGVLALALAACGSSGSADSTGEYPNDDITMTVTYAAGGPTDIAGRAVAKALEKELDTSVVVENVEGASGAVGSAKVAKAKPDGLSIGMTTASAVSRVPIIEEVGFTLDDLTPVGVVTQGPGFLMVKKDSPYKTIDDLVKAAKASPNKVKIGAAGAQTPQAVEVERWKSEYDVPVQLVPFQGDAPSVTGLLGDNVDAIVPAYGEGVQAQYEAGKIRPLAVMGPERVPYLPDVPTLAESGFDDLVYGISTYILIVPKGTPEEIVTKLEDSLETSVKDPETYKALDGEVMVPKEFIGSEALSKQMEDELKTLKPVLEGLFG